MSNEDQSASVLNYALRLSIPERIQLVTDIWDTIALEPEQIPITKAHQDELDRRIVSMRQSPHEIITWEEARRKLDPEKR